MNVTFEGGTAQQQRWVQDAIAQCKFNTQQLLADVVVSWGAFPGNADTRHPYMVTTPTGVGSDGYSFLITIAPWADDPNNPNNQGLPDPAGDIYDFYKQSFVHELGHVVTDCTFNPGGADTDSRIAQVCSMFWHPEVDSSAGRRYGTIADWDAVALSWGDEIRESVAETFKIAFYEGRLIFTNRTDWKIDQDNWAALINMWSYTTPIFHETFQSNAGSYNSQNNTMGGYQVPAGSLHVPQDFVIADGHFTLLPELPGGDIQCEMTLVTPPLAYEGIASVRIDEDFFQSPANQFIQIAVGAIDSNLDTASFVGAILTLTANSGPNVHDPLLVAGRAGGPSIVLPAAPLPTPLWLVCRVSLAAGTAIAELWFSDPEAGGTPSYSVASAYSPLPANPLLGGSLTLWAAGETPAQFTNQWGIPGCSASDWRWANYEISPEAPYPYGPPYGNMAPGPYAQGNILISPAP